MLASKRAQPGVVGSREPEFERLCNVLRSSWDIHSVAAQADVAPATIYFWLDGTTKTPRIDTLSRVARVIGYRFKLVRAK